MAVNKVVYNTENGPETLIDLTNDSVTPETLAEGITAHDASGNTVVGLLPIVNPDTFVAKNQGKANVGKILVVGTDGNFTLINMPEGSTSGDVTGVLDESNNILLVGDGLADGTYTLRFKNRDGTVSTLCDLVVTSIIAPTFTNFADPTSADWKEGYRLTTDIDGLSAVSGSVVTNYIDVQTGDTVEITGIDFTDSNNRQAYRGNNNAIGSIAKASAWETSYTGRFSDISYDSNSFKFTVTVQVTDMKVRFSGLGTSANVVIKIKRNGSYI